MIVVLLGALGRAVLCYWCYLEHWDRLCCCAVLLVLLGALGWAIVGSWEHWELWGRWDCCYWSYWELWGRLCCVTGVTGSVLLLPPPLWQLDPTSGCSHPDVWLPW